MPGPKSGSRAVCDCMKSWAEGQGAPGLGYMIFAEGEARGPIAGRLPAEAIAAIEQATGMGDGDAVFFSAGKELEAAKLAGQARIKLGADLDIVEKGTFKLCWKIGRASCRERVCQYV